MLPPTVLALRASWINLIMREKEEKVLNLNKAEQLSSSEVNEKWAIMRQTQNFSLLLKVFLARTWTHTRLFAFWLGLEKILCASFCLLVIINSTIHIFLEISIERARNLVTVRDYPALNSEGGEEYEEKNHLNLFLFQRLRLGKHLKKFFYSSSLLFIPSLKLSRYLSSPGSRPLHLSVEWRSE